MEIVLLAAAVALLGGIYLELRRLRPPKPGGEEDLLAERLERDWNEGVASILGYAPQGEVNHET